ncbi:MAG: hypothetical protein QM784_21840 [Polyangiaceae bacterium]
MVRENGSKCPNVVEAEVSLPVVLFGHLDPERRQNLAKSSPMDVLVVDNHAVVIEEVCGEGHQGHPIGSWARWPLKERSLRTGQAGRVILHPDSGRATWLAVHALEDTRIK